MSAQEAQQVHVMCLRVRVNIFTSLRDGNRPHRIVGQPLVTANDVGHWDQKTSESTDCREKKKREEFDSHV